MVQEHLAGSVAQVLGANASFYRAFTKGDFEAMRGLWAERNPVTCQHPLSPTLIGLEAVLESWRQILREPPPLAMRCDDPVVHLLGDVALVSCYEGNGDHPAHLVATNGFVREVDGWRMIHHQAGPLGRARSRPPAPTLN
jgi:ketosteroid isomerase-like protein